MAQLLEGKVIAEKLREQLRQDVASLPKRPVLVSVLVGMNAGACTYCKSQEKAAQDIGIEYRLEHLEAEIHEAELVAYIQKLNADPEVTGVIVQMPLPQHMDYKKISRFIAPEKDVEGMHPLNIGRLFSGKTRLVPCTAASVMEILNSTGVDLYGKDAVVIGHSEIVGKPLCLLLLDKFATVSVCHIGTSHAGKLEEYVRRAEVLVVAVGKPGLVKGEWIRPGAIVIDVGISRVGERLVGDVEFEEAQKRASFITPVPGGVGPLTVTILMRNVVEAAKLQL